MKNEARVRNNSRDSQKDRSSDIRILVQFVLYLIFAQKWYSDKALQRCFYENKWLTQADRAEIAENIFDMIRRWRLLWAMANCEPSFEPFAWRKLWAAFEKWRRYQESGALDAGDTRFAALLQERKIRESIPDWLDEAGEKELGQSWDDILKALNQKPRIVLRANTLKTTVQALQQLLHERGIVTELLTWAPHALVLDRFYNVFSLEWFQQGFFESQDAASQAVALMVGAQPGMRVIDGCAGRGGKALYLAALMANRGKIIALDTDSRKLNLLNTRIRRAGVDIVESRLIKSNKVIKRMAESADRVLLDTPCSGTGILRRHPEARWRLKPADLERLVILQREILASYCKMVKRGGHLIYATCSVLPREGEQQIRWFLDRHGKNFRLLSEQRFCPSKQGFDGFYLAALERLA